MRCRDLLVWLPLLAGCASLPEPPAACAPDCGYTILVSFDGFRHDYLDRGVTPVLDSLARNGVRADALIPVMPTKTFPNHYAIATGLYAGRHGIVANQFYDDSMGGFYSPADRATVENAAWYRGEPIWVRAQRAGLRTATMFWIGSEAPVAGVAPTYWKKFDARITAEQRVDTVLHWLGLPPAERPRLLTLYFNFTDDAGSRFGPDAPATTAAIARADSMMRRLLTGAGRLPHGDSLNVVVVSDHGMARAGRWLMLDAYLPLDDIDARFAGPFVSLWLDGDSSRIADARDALRRMPHVRTYTRAELPASWHWDDPRVGDLVVVADPFWQIGYDGRTSPAQGAHGWPPDVSEMRGIFVASGPGIRAAGRIPAFESVHVHPFLAALLGVTPAHDIDGKVEVLQRVLR